MDPKLSMKEEIHCIQQKARPKIRAILNTRSYYDTVGLLQQYKAHVLRMLEQSALAIFNAAQSYLDSLIVQRSFIQDLDLTEEEAFLKFQLVPLKLRRDIAALRFLHKIKFGRSASRFRGFVP